jgi:50S ribosomal subunit-associated GTPase HflX
VAEAGQLSTLERSREMTAGLIVLSASVLTIFAFGVLIGYRLGERKLAAQARRQAAAQSFLYKQLQELQAARQRDYPARARRDYPSQRNVGSFSKAQAV